MKWRFLAASVAAAAAVDAAAITLASDGSDAALALVAAAAGAAATAPAEPTGLVRATLPQRIEAESTVQVAAPYDVLSSLGAGAEPAVAETIEFAEQAPSEVSFYALMLAGIGLIGVLYHRRTQG